jgi:hypothetical protein
MLQIVLGHVENNHLHSGFLGLLHMDHLNQMDGQLHHLVQKPQDSNENALSPTHVSYSLLSLQFNLEPVHTNVRIVMYTKRNSQVMLRRNQNNLILLMILAG